jgi:hypothetical protein
VNGYNSLDLQCRSIVEIGGGINLEPRNFKIKTPQASARLQEFRRIMQTVGTEWQSIDGSGKWIRNGTATVSIEQKGNLPRTEWTSKKETTSGSCTYKHIQSDSEPQYWSAIDSQTGSWRDCRKMDSETYQERAYEPASKKLQIAYFRSGTLKSCIIGQMDDEGRIVFRRSNRTDVLKPQEPPIWFPSH